MVQFIYVSQKEVPHDYKAITACTNKLFIVRWEPDASDAAWMGSAFCEERSGCKIIDSNNTESTTRCEILIIWRDSDRHKLITLSLVRAAFQLVLRIWFAYVPISDLSLLSNRHKLVVVKRSNWEAVDSTHALCLISNSLFLLQVPAKDRLIASCSHQMDIVRENLNSCYLAWVFF